jgi:ubiquinone/menaquinone biosynthesis C-methylase UbiE
MSSHDERDYFEFVSRLGMTKHYGSMDATRELIELCHIGGGAYVLDVGCGVGATPCYLARAVGCRVMGVDLLDSMVEQARRRARAEGVQDRVEFSVGDARDLPFEDNAFDVVITESLNVFFDDKAHAMSEYVRVVKPGGYVGITEMTWLQPPSAQLEATFKEMAHATALDAAGWQGLMQGAGLLKVTGSAHRIDLSAESRGRVERYGRLSMLRIVLRMLGMVIGDQRSRRIMQVGLGARSRDMLDVVGYGVFAGQKSSGD